MSSFIGRVISASITAGKRALVRATVLGRADEVPHVQPYGLQSRPQPGSEAIVITIGETGDDAVAIVVGDRRYTLALAAGEVALADDLGQKVHLTRTGIVVSALVVIVDSPDVRIGEGPTYARVVREGDTLAAGLTSATGGVVTGTIALLTGTAQVTAS